MTLIVLCGDVESNPGPWKNLTSDHRAGSRARSDIPSTPTGLHQTTVMCRDKRYMRPCFQWQGDDSSFLSESQCPDDVPLSEGHGIPEFTDTMPEMSQTSDELCSLFLFDIDR